MRADANRIALRAIRNILGGATAVSLKVGRFEHGRGCDAVGAALVDSDGKVANAAIRQ